MKGLLSLLFLILAVLASAGSYELTPETSTFKNPSGGTLAPVNPEYGDPDYERNAVGDDSTVWPYGGTVRSDPNFASAQGTVTFKFRWVPAYAGEPFPAKVLITKRANVAVGWEEGHRDEVLFTDTGDNYQDTFYSGGIVRDGKAYEIVDGAANLTVSFSPAASIESDDPSFLPLYLTARVLVSVSVSNAPTLSLVGPNAAKQLAIGQKLTATVSGGGVPANSGDRYAWSKPTGGAAFKGYDPTLAANQFSAFVAPPNTMSSMSCYFAKPASASVKCTFHSGALNADFELTAPVTVMKPTSEGHTEDCGLMQLYPSSSNPSDFVLYGKTIQVLGVNNGAPYGTGMYAKDKRTDPPPSSTGTLAYLQLVTVSNTKNNGTPQVKSGLDGGFPYHGTFSSNGTDQAYMDDVPGGPLGATTYSYVKDGSYTAHLMYKPSASAAGASVYVPLYKLVWKAKGQCTYYNTNGSWSQADNGSGITTSGAADFNYPDDAFPTWNTVVTSG